VREDEEEADGSDLFRVSGGAGGADGEYFDEGREEGSVGCGARRVA